MGLRGVSLAVVLVHVAAHTGDVTEGGKIQGHKLKKGTTTKSRVESGNTVAPFRVLK